MLLWLTPPPAHPTLSYVCSSFSGADISCNDSRKWMVVQCWWWWWWWYMITLTVSSEAPLQPNYTYYYSTILLLLPPSGQSTLNPLSPWAAWLHGSSSSRLDLCKTIRPTGDRGRSITRLAGREMLIVQQSSQLWRSFFTSDRRLNSEVSD